jgi:hypothetical protein
MILASGLAPYSCLLSQISLSPLLQRGVRNPRKKNPPLKKGDNASKGDLNSPSAPDIVWTFKINF